MNKMTKAIGLLVIAAFLLAAIKVIGRGSYNEPAVKAAEAHVQADSSLPPLLSLSPKAASLANLTWSYARVKSAPVTVDATAEVCENLNSVVKVNSMVSGSVDNVYVKVGDIVPKGHLLAKIRSQEVEQIESDLLQQRAQVKADLSQALLDIDAQLQSLNAQILLSRSSYERAKTLFEEKVGSRAEMETAKTTLAKNQIDIDVQTQKRLNTLRIFDEKLALVTEPLRQKLALLGVSKIQSSRLLATGKIEPVVEVLAPTQGRISHRACNLGEVVQSGEHLFTVGDYRTVWLTAQIHEKDVNQVKLGQAIALTCESYPDKKFYGHLNYIADSIDKETRTLPVRAEADNPNLLLKAQMFANMKIIVAERRMLIVPKEAIQDAGHAKVVYLAVSDGKFRETPVKLGVQCGDDVEILQGLKDGDRVVTNGSFELRAQALKNAESKER